MFILREVKIAVTKVFGHRSDALTWDSLSCSMLRLMFRCYIAFYVVTINAYI